MKEIYNRSEGKLLKQFHLTVESNLSAVKKVFLWLENSVEQMLDKTVYLQIQIALIEGFTNVVKYAHSTLPSNTPIELLINIFEDLVEIKIWDYGIGFDLAATLQEELKTSFEKSIKKESHRGLLLMNSLTDTLFYIRENEVRNCLIMRKYIAKNISL